MYIHAGTAKRHQNVFLFVKADIPEPVIKGSFASPETIAHVATQKFMMASPLYRQEQE
jgi:transposase